MLNLIGMLDSPTGGVYELLGRDVQAERAFVRVGKGELASLYLVAPGVLYAPTLDLWLAFSGTPDNPTLHLRSVFDKADTQRFAVSSGKP